MKAWIPRRIGYYTVFPSQGPDIFWLSLQKIVKATLWAQMRLRRSMKQEGRGAGHNFWKNDIAQGHNINQLKSNGSKITSQIQLNLDPQNLQAKWHTQKCQDSSKALSKGMGGSQIVGMILLLISIWNNPAFKNWPHHIPWPLHSPSVMAHTLGMCFFLNLNKSISYPSLCLSLNFLQWDIKSLRFIMSWNEALWVSAGLKSWERGAKGREEKAVGKKYQGIPFITCQKIC